MSIVTNLVVCLAITTTQMAPIPCPDKIPGCCVLHYQEMSETRYEPYKLRSNERTCSGLSWNADTAVCAVNGWFGSLTNAPKYFPLSIHYIDERYGEGDVRRYTVSSHPIGWIGREEIIKMAEELENKRTATEGGAK